MVTRNPRLPPLQNIINKNFHILRLSPKLGRIFQEPPRVIYRQPPNLKSLLVRAKVPRPTEAGVGTFRLHQRNCVTCQVLKVSNSFTSFSSGRTFKILGSYTCTTVGVVYMIGCNDCGKQYVGETGGELRQRHRGHRQEMKKGNTPLGKHFNSGCSNFYLIILQAVGELDKGGREAKELFWINQLQTFSPKGINVRKINKL